MFDVGFKTIHTALGRRIHGWGSLAGAWCAGLLAWGLGLQAAGQEGVPLRSMLDTRVTLGTVGACALLTLLGCAWGWAGHSLFLASSRERWSATFLAPGWLYVFLTLPLAAALFGMSQPPVWSAQLLLSPVLVVPLWLLVRRPFLNQTKLAWAHASLRMRVLWASAPVVVPLVGYAWLLRVSTELYGELQAAMFFTAAAMGAWAGSLFELTRAGRAAGVLSLTVLAVPHALAVPLTEGQRLTLLAVPPASSLYRMLSYGGVDEDNDGHERGGLLGGDCNDQRADVHPLALDVPDNGVDENCFNGDLAPASLGTLCPPPPACRPRGRPRSIVLVTLDALREDMVTPSQMPNLVQLGRDGHRFTHVEACAATSTESLQGILSGTPLAGPEPVRHQLELLKARGFTLELISRFETISMLPGPWDHAHVPPDRKEVAFPRGAAVPDGAPATHAAVVAHLVDAIHTLPEPFFLHAHLMDLHGPVAAHPPCTDASSGADLYRCAVPAVDGYVASLSQALRERGSPDISLVLSADHGELLGEHGRHGHALTLDEPVLHVPLVVWAARTHARALPDVPMDCRGVWGLWSGLASGCSLSDALKGVPRGLRVSHTAFPHLRPATEWFGVSFSGHKGLMDARRHHAHAVDLTRDPQERHALPATGNVAEQLDAWMSYAAAAKQHPQDPCAPLGASRGTRP